MYPRSSTAASDLNAALLACRPAGFGFNFPPPPFSAGANHLDDVDDDQGDELPESLTTAGHYELAPHYQSAAGGWSWRASIVTRHHWLVETALHTKSGTLVAVRRGRDPEVVLEQMPLYVRLGMRLLFAHGSGEGKRRERLLRSREVEEIFRKRSVLEGIKFDSTRHAIKRIEHFVRAYHIDTSELLETNLALYRTLNEFFFRKLRPDARPIASPHDLSVISSAADCRLAVYEDVESAQEFWIKGQNFNLPSLLMDDTMASYFEGGSLAIFRLAPMDYHRFHSPVDAVVGETKYIHGQYFTVNPTVVNNPALDVFTENKRDVTYLHASTPSSKPTLVAYVQIGALLVGSIRQTARRGARVRRGDEVGYFAYGGSTIVVLFPRRSVKFDRDLLRNSKVPLETMVKVGERIGEWC